AGDIDGEDELVVALRLVAVERAVGAGGELDERAAGRFAGDLDDAVLHGCLCLGPRIAAAGGIEDPPSRSGSVRVVVEIGLEQRDTQRAATHCQRQYQSPQRSSNHGPPPVTKTRELICGSNCNALYTGIKALY